MSDDKPWQLLRFTDLHGHADNPITIWDEASQILLIDREQYDQLHPFDQRRIMRLRSTTFADTMTLVSPGGIL